MEQRVLDLSRTIDIFFTSVITACMIQAAVSGPVRAETSDGADSAVSTQDSVVQVALALIPASAPGHAPVFTAAAEPELGKAAAASRQQAMRAFGEAVEPLFGLALGILVLLAGIIGPIL